MSTRTFTVSPPLLPTSTEIGSINTAHSSNLKKGERLIYLHQISRHIFHQPLFLTSKLFAHSAMVDRILALHVLKLCWSDGPIGAFAYCKSGHYSNSKVGSITCVSQLLFQPELGFLANFFFAHRENSNSILPTALAFLHFH